MANNIIRRTWKQGGLVNIEDLRGSAFQAEDGGHTFLISGVDENGDTIPFTGSVGAVFLRADGTDVAITGIIANGIASVTLTDECYDVPGRFGLTIYVTDSPQKVAVYAAVGSVSRTSTGVVSPGAVEDVADLIAEIAAAVSTIPQDYSAVSTAVEQESLEIARISGTALPIVIELGSINTNTGKESASSDGTRLRTNYIPVEELSNYTLKITSGSGITVSAVYLLYFSGMIDTSFISPAVYKSYSADGIAFSSVSGAKYLRIRIQGTGMTTDGVTAELIKNNSDIETINSELTQINSDITTITGNERIRLVAGKYINLSGSSVTMSGGVPVYSGNSSAGFAVGMMQCVAGDYFIINGHGGSSTRLYGFVDSSGNILEVSDASETKADYLIKAPTNSAWIIVHTNEGSASYKGVLLVEKVENLRENNTHEIIYMSRETSTNHGVTFTWSGKQCTVSGETSSTKARNTQWEYTNGFPDGVIAGNEYYIDFFLGEKSSVYVNVIYLLDDDSKIYDYYDSSAFITVPSNAVGMTICLCVLGNTEIESTVVGYRLEVFSSVEKENHRQIENIKKSLEPMLPHNFLPEIGTFEDSTSHEVSFTWEDDNKTCIVDGTVSGEEDARSAHIIDHRNGLPTQFEPGKTYSFKFTSSEESVVFYRLVFWDEDTYRERPRYANSTSVTIPDYCVGMDIRFEVASGTTADDVIVTLEVESVNDDQTFPGNRKSRMLVAGSSFLIGQIYPDGATSHSCSFDDSPYGNIAIGMGLNRNNVNRILVSSAGLLKKNSKNENVLTTIKGLDVSGYDYVVAEYNRPDLGVNDAGFQLGDLTSTAGDGTIVGGILDLLAYVKTNNPNATVIIVGAPPSDQREGYSYSNVFTAIYGNGVSIGEADTMIHRLAVREHFIFIDWEDLNLSYYYPDLTYGSNVHPMEDATCRTMGLYLARQCNYTTSLVKVMRADMET